MRSVLSVWGGACAWCRWRPACLLGGQGSSAELHGSDVLRQSCLPCLQGRDANRRLQRSIKASRQRDRLPALLEHVLGLLAVWQVQEGSAFTYDGQDYKVAAGQSGGRSVVSCWQQPLWADVGWGRNQHAAPAHSTGRPTRRMCSVLRGHASYHHCMNPLAC